MMKMKLLVVVTPPYIYHGCSTQKTFWEKNMKLCGRLNVRKNKEIKGNDKIVTLDISLKFDSLDKMKIKSSE